MAKEESRKRKRVRLHEHTAENDRRYRGPLNYQHFQMLGWLCIVASVALGMLQAGVRLDTRVEERFGSIIPVLQYMAELSLPFLLISNFSRILNNAEGYKKQLLRNGACAVGIAAACVLIVWRYVIGSAEMLVTDPWDVTPIVTTTFRAMNEGGFIAVNIFVDLFLCTLFMFFLNVRPKKVFTGKKVLFLRVLALIPIAYEVACLVFKFQAAKGEITLPLWSFPLLTVKPPMTFVLFVFLALHMKAREYRFCRHGRSHEEYQEFLQSNRNSLHFSVYLAIMLVVTAVIDFVLLIVMSTAAAPSVEAIQGAGEEEIYRWVEIAETVGFGNSVSLAFIAPLMLLYSYSRQPKSKMISTFVPMIGIGLIALVILEGIHQGIGFLPIQKINLIEVLSSMEASAGGF